MNWHLKWTPSAINSAKGKNEFKKGRPLQSLHNNYFNDEKIEHFTQNDSIPSLEKKEKKVVKHCSK